MRYLRVCFLATALALLCGAAEATSQGTSAIQRWHSMDDCAKQAQAAFPDFSADSNAKREAKLEDCLNARNLPPRQPESPTQ